MLHIPASKAVQQILGSVSINPLQRTHLSPSSTGSIRSLSPVRKIVGTVEGNPSWSPVTNFSVSLLIQKSEFSLVLWISCVTGTSDPQCWLNKAISFELNSLSGLNICTSWCRKSQKPASLATWAPRPIATPENRYHFETLDI